MLLINIITMLGLTIIWSENPMVECNMDFFVWGCARPSQNQIIVGYAEPDKVIYHELGHMLFSQDNEVKELISKYPSPRYYPSYAYPTEWHQINERTADYFEMYMRYSDFPDKFPEVNEMFDEKMIKFN
jgi:hypothetical protein